jgi:hypothetical protein
LIECCSTDSEFEVLITARLLWYTALGINREFSTSESDELQRW